MTQTSKIAGTLIIAWIVFVTVRGELPAYLSMLGMGKCDGSDCCSLGGAGVTGGQVQCAWYDLPCKLAQKVTQPAPA